MDKIKILIAYHERLTLIKSGILTPVQVGRALAAVKFEDMPGDDAGDNISFLNKNFCELTAVYWAWKNYAQIGNPEYIGLMHYRRHFLFGAKNYKPDFYGLVKFKTIDSKYLAEDITSDANIEKIINGSDAVIPNPVDVEETAGCKNNYEHYKKFHHIEDYDKALEIIKNKTPEFAEYAQDYNDSKLAYFLNMFIFKKEIFFKYCEWIFAVLFELYENTGAKDEKYQERMAGFISERLTGIFINKLIKENYRIKTLPVSFVEKAEPETAAQPEKSGVIPIAVNCSNGYVPYFSVFLQSVIDSAGPGTVYEINVFERDISVENKIKIKEQIKNKNLKINFIHLAGDFKSFEALYGDNHFSSETWYRLFIPNLLKQHNKCLYLDIDTVVLRDLKELYDTDLEGKMLGAVSDAIYIAFCKDTVIKKMSEYTKECLELDSPLQYFQGGVAVMNLEKMRKMNSEQLLCGLAKNKKVHFADQCLYNFCFKDDVKYVDMKWNYQVYDQERKNWNLKRLMPVKTLRAYCEAEKNPYVVHYSGAIKPWFNPDKEFADLWWQYARKTPFYETILQRLINYASNKNISLVANYARNKRNYRKYRFLANFAFGETKKRYLKKKLYFKEKTEQAEKIINK